MHPIERLRFVARADDIPGRYLVSETAMALSQFVDDRASLLIAIRRLLDRQPHVGQLAWLAAQTLAAPDPAAALWDAVDQIESDVAATRLAYDLDDTPTAIVGSELASALADRVDAPMAYVEADGPSVAVVEAISHAELVVVALDALGPEEAIAPAQSLVVAATGRALGCRVWGFAPAGVGLEARTYAGLARRWRSSREVAGEAGGSNRADLQIGAGWGRPRRGGGDGRVGLDSGLLDAVVTAAGPVSVEQAIRDSGCAIAPELF